MKFEEIVFIGGSALMGYIKYDSDHQELIIYKPKKDAIDGCLSFTKGSIYFNLMKDGNLTLRVNSSTMKYNQILSDVAINHRARFFEFLKGLYDAEDLKSIIKSKMDYRIEYNSSGFFVSRIENKLDELSRKYSI